MTSSPEDTIAIVVGIEEYAAGASWRLNGPVPDACRFITWLRSCGVPARNITLLAAPRNDSMHLIEEQRSTGVATVEARADTIRERLINRLPNEKSNLLIIHWGGHGVVDDRNERRLIYSDAVAHDRRNMNITGLLSLLRSDMYRGHPCQRIIIDSCLTYARAIGWQGGMPNEEFQAGKLLVAVDQITLFAASDGERAKNDDSLRSGLFSQAVLEGLENLSAGAWPPDFTEVKRHVDLVFNTRRADRRTHQVPSHIWFRKGSNEEDLVFTDKSPPAIVGHTRHRYRDEQVRRIAPRDLLDRETELAALRDFCTADSVPSSYQWWSADAWAGKSALAASFVLEPPPGVQIVSFFVTARWAGHDNRITFAQIVLEQLADLLNRPMPTFSEVSRDLEFSAMLREAAAACSERGQRLILVVDGLDEDSGRGGSIAELLPTDPPPGLRIIVTGRPNPELPSSVPDDHPLRDLSIVRPLAPASAARIARAAMEHELDTLLEGSPEERDLVGLIAAARGGLSGSDLEELTSWTRRRLTKVINGPAGRSFTRRASDWRPESSPEVFLLAHENLQRAAAEELGEDELRKYQKRLDDWAERYRSAGWPPDTPQYLLKGYFSQLEPSRKAVYAVSMARHERLLAVSRSDVAALAEIAEARAAVIGDGRPDVSTMMRLAMHEESLRDRNARTPTRLPAALAMLGDIDRAEALATAITDSNRRLYAIDALIETLVLLGNSRRAVNFAGSVEEGEGRSHAVAALVGALAAAGELDAAERLSNEIPDGRGRAAAVQAIIRRANLDSARARQLAEPVVAFDGVLAALALAIGRDESPMAAMDVVNRINDGAARQRVIADLIHDFAQRRDTVAAETVVSMTHPSQRFSATAELITNMAAIGHIDQARELLDDVIDENRGPSPRRGASGRIATRLEHAEYQGSAIEALALGLADAGKIAEAYYEVKGIQDLAHSNKAILNLIDRIDNIGWARALVRSLQLTSPLYGPRATTSLLKLFCRKGELAWAERLAPHTHDAAEAYTVIAESAVARGMPDRGRELVKLAESAARKKGHDSSQSRILKGLAEAVAETGDAVRAESLVRFVADSNEGSGQLVELLSPLLVRAGGYSLAESFAQSSRHLPPTRVQLLVPLVRRLWQSGEHERARSIAIDAQQTVDNPEDPLVISPMVELLASCGESDRAIELTRNAPGIFRRRALAGLCRGLGFRGDLETVDAVFDVFDDSYEVREAIEALAEVIGSESVYPLLGKIDKIDERARAMVAIAERAGPEFRSRLLIEAAELGHWTELLRVLARDDPTATMEMVDEYVQRWEP